MLATLFIFGIFVVMIDRVTKGEIEELEANSRASQEKLKNLGASTKEG